MLLYAITDRHQLPGPDKLAGVEKFVAAAAQAGVDYVQLREKDLPPRELEKLATTCAEGVRRARQQGSPTKLLINSRCDVAIACGADGVHLRSATSGEISAGDARSIFACAGNSDPVIAVSCHGLAEVLRAESEGADFAVFGPIFGKGTTPGTGLDALRIVCSRKSAVMPVLALGGVTAANASRCLTEGAAGIAAVRLFQQGIDAAILVLRGAQGGLP